MANIPKAAKEAGIVIERSKALREYRRKKSDRKEHVFSMSVEGFKARIYLGVQSQRGKKVRISSAQDEKITSYIERYASNLYSLFSKKGSASGKFFYTFIGGTPKDFKVRISGDGNIMQHLSSLREEAGLRAVSNSIKNAFKDVAEYRNIAIDISHIEESTVASQYATEALMRYERQGMLPADRASYEKLKTIINFNPKSKKVATVYVEDTFWYLNQSTVEEAEVTGLLNKALEQDWLQDAMKLMSDDVSSHVSKELTKIAAKKIKGSKIVSLNTDVRSSKGTDSRTINHPKKRKPSQSIEHFSEKIEVLGRNRPQNWSLLIPKINSMLHNKIRANMIAPRLIYRTGKLARSAEVTSVQETKEGLPTFIYNYDRDPYDVFDRTLGKSPWKSPDRDPRSLIDKSIRDVMRELAVGRFYTRRA